MPVSCSSARRFFASASAFRSFSISSRSFLRKCSSSRARTWSVIPSECVTYCLLRSPFIVAPAGHRAYNARTHAGSDDRFADSPPPEDHQLHARDDGVSDALFPDRFVLGRAAGEGGGRRGWHCRQLDV